ncbi:MAG: hypothetical protein NUW37_10460 [Planctomycetes bacterium]|nr:hypothetical protein [Planctomycetota bacterium]
MTADDGFEITLASNDFSREEIEEYARGASETGEVVKIGKRSTCVLLQVGRKPLMLKYYLRSPWFLPARWTRERRARRAFENALEVQKRGVGCAKPVALLIGGSISSAIFEFISAPDFCSQLRGLNAEGHSSASPLVSSFGAYLKRMMDCGVFVRDTKLSNFIAKNDGDGWNFFLVDFDGVKIRKKISEKERIQAVERVCRDLREISGGREIVDAFTSSAR